MKRRRVFRALIGYGIVSFAVLQIIEPVMHGLQLPEWVLSATVVALGIGFPFTLVLAWALDLKGGRIERTGPAPSGRLLLTLVVVGLALGTPGVGWYFWKSHRAAPAREESASIAVLPFKDLSPAKDQDWMCDGIPEELVRAVVAALQLRVSSDEAVRLRRSGTTNSQAFEMYLRGRQYVRTLGPENQELARQMFKRAIALDPAFALPRAGLADADITLVQWLLVPKEAQPALRAEALAASDEALRLDPDLAEAHVARANVLAGLGRNDEADESFRRATALAPGLRDAWFYYGRFLFSVQRYADAARAFEESARRNPDDYDSLTLAAMPYERLDQPANARSARKRAVEAADRVLRNSPDDVRALYLSGSVMVAQGERKTGIDRLQQAIALRPYDFTGLYNAACR